MHISEEAQKISSEMEEASFNDGDRVLLIDLENCPTQINQLMNDLEQYSHVVVCYAQSGAKIPLDWIVPLTSTVNNDRLKIVKMPNNGKNAADFGITFWAGVFMAQLPIETHFDIVSNDADLDHVVSLLKNQQRSAERISNKKDNSQLASASKGLVNMSIDDCLHEYCSHLVKYSKPAKKATLLNSIKSKFKANIDPEELIKGLIKKGVINVKDDKITYNQQKIDKVVGI
jgi:PIN domain